MKVKFRIPTKCDGIIASDVNWPVGDWEINFCSSPIDKTIEYLEVTIANIDSANWPTLLEVPIASVHSEHPRFPFEINPNALKISHYRREFDNLEGLLSTICSFEFDWADTETTWLPGKEDKTDGLMLNYRVTAAEPKRPQIRSEDLWMAVAASTSSDDRLVALSHLKQANLNFNRRYYIDAARHSLFLVEHLFANGKYKTNAVKAAYSQSTSLRKAFEFWVLENEGFFKRLLEKCELAVDYKDKFGSFTSALVTTRGKLQHANASLSKFWSSSKQEEFESVALALISFADSVAFELRQKLFGETLRRNGWNDNTNAN